MLKTIITTVIATLSVVFSFALGKSIKKKEFEKERELNELRIKEAETIAKQAVAKADMTQKASKIAMSKVEHKTENLSAGSHEELVTLIGKMVEDSKEKYK